MSNSQGSSFHKYKHEPSSPLEINFFNLTHQTGRGDTELAISSKIRVHLSYKRWLGTAGEEWLSQSAQAGVTWKCSSVPRTSVQDKHWHTISTLVSTNTGDLHSESYRSKHSGLMGVSQHWHRWLGRTWKITGGEQKSWHDYRYGAVQDSRGSGQLVMTAGTDGPAGWM